MKLPITLIYIISFVLITMNSGCKNTANPATTNTDASTQPVIKANDGVILGGIPNLGATCYMNAVLQILKSFYLAKINEHNDTLGRSLQSLFQTIATNQALATEDQARNVFQALNSQLGWTINPKQQQDAQELITSLFNWMNLPRACTQAKFINPTTFQERSSGNDFWFIHQVELPTEKNATPFMQALFDQSIASEFVHVKFRETDANDSRVEKVKLLNNLDNLYKNMFVLGLKRSATQGGLPLADGGYNRDFTKSKLNQKVQNPMTLVIKKEQTVEKDRDRHYVLVGFIQHIGEDMDSGHYIAYVQKEKEGDWICYNDDSSELVTKHAAEEAAHNAYVFFYQLNP